MLSYPLHRRSNQDFPSAVGPRSAAHPPVAASKDPGSATVSSPPKLASSPPPTFRTTSRYDDSSSTYDICTQFQQRRLDRTPRSSVCVHSKQTADAQCGSFNSSPAPCDFPSGTCSHRNCRYQGLSSSPLPRGPQGSSRSLRLSR